MAENLPTFEEMRARAFALLGDAEDELSFGLAARDWTHCGTRPSCH